MIDLEPHALAALFPPILEDELAELGRDIALHGQLEPIVLYQGKILDGVNRYRARRRMDREPWTTEFNQERHLTPAQKAAIAVEWEVLNREEMNTRRRESLAYRRLRRRSGAAFCQWGLGL
jgi:hypothetical protein